MENILPESVVEDGGRENRLNTAETEDGESRGDELKNKNVSVFLKTRYTSITKCRMLMETVIY
jgi:hypothetical protein